MYRLLSLPSFVILSLLFFYGLVEAATYKCVDAQGQIEYRALPRADAQCVDVKAQSKPPADPEEALKRRRERVEALQNDTTAQQQTQGNADQRAEYCKTALYNQEILQSEREVMRTDGEGNRVVLSADERASALEQTRKDVDYFCN